MDKVVHQAAGRSLKEACKKIPKENGVRCPTGEARLTHAGKLPSAYVLHTVGPKISSKVTKSDKKKLWKCYHNCMKLAEQRCSYVSNPKRKHHSYMSKIQSSKEHAFKCKLARDHASVTFPCISTGSYSYPANKAAKVAITSLVDFARHNTEGKVKEIHISCCKAQKDIPHLLHAMRTVK